jgi:hypothetical protein
MSSWKKSVFWATVIGFGSDWFPSRRSVESHVGALLFTCDGHRRLGRSSGVYGVYFRDGSVLSTHQRFKLVSQRIVTHSIGILISLADDAEVGVTASESRVRVSWSFLRPPAAVEIGADIQ